LSIADKQVELEIILIEISQEHKVNSQFFPHIWNIDLIQIQQYYDKQVTVTGGHIWEEDGKRGKLRK
jgi:hypothetical protein